MSDCEHYVFTAIMIEFDPRQYTNATVVRNQISSLFKSDEYVSFRLYTADEHKEQFKYIKEPKNKLILYILFTKLKIFTFGLKDTLCQHHRNISHYINNITYKYPDLDISYDKIKLIKPSDNEYKTFVTCKMSGDLKYDWKYLRESSLNNTILFTEIYNSGNKLSIVYPYTDELVGKGVLIIVRHPIMICKAINKWRHNIIDTKYFEAKVIESEIFKILMSDHNAIMQVKQQQADQERLAQEQEMLAAEQAREERLKKEKEREEEIVKIDNTVLQCTLCRVNKINIVLNCGHVCCNECSVKLKECHNCRGEIQTMNQLFI